ncbi:MAG: endo-1,3-alpha-glucanase family glycosylhydrolase, partial [Janthinobacterium lividum]
MKLRLLLCLLALLFSVPCLSQTPVAPNNGVQATVLPFYFPVSAQATIAQITTTPGVPSTVPPLTQIAALQAQLSALQATLTAQGSSTAGPFNAYIDPFPVDGTKPIVAHYVMSSRDYSGSETGDETEVRQAIQNHINVFALNEGDWNGSGYYVPDTAALVAAIHAVSPGGQFKFCLSEDGLGAAQIASFMTLYASDPNYWHVNGRPVLSSFGGETSSPASYLAFWGGVDSALTAAGITPYFLPEFNAQQYSNGGTNNAVPPTVPLLTSNTSVWNTPGQGQVDGLFSDAIGANNPAYNSIYASVLHGLGKTFMGSVNPEYWPSENANDYFNEMFGAETLIAQWQSIINVQKPDFVELFTWNDTSEMTYFSPQPDKAVFWPYGLRDANANVIGYQASHAGFLALSQYYIQWYKTGVQPTVNKDSLYYFYRVHPKAAVATGAGEVKPSWVDPLTLDDVFVTTICTAPATLTVNSGGTV